MSEASYNNFEALISIHLLVVYNSSATMWLVVYLTTLFQLLRLYSIYDRMISQR
jgi:hypothetical protein